MSSGGRACFPQIRPVWGQASATSEACPLTGQNCGKQARPPSSQQLLQPLIPRSADRKLGAVRENRDPAVLRVQLHPRQALDVEQIRAVDAHEAARVELRLEIPQRLFLEQRAPAGLEGD